MTEIRKVAVIGAGVRPGIYVPEGQRLRRRVRGMGVVFNAI